MREDKKITIVDITNKPIVKRTAIAEGWIFLKKDTLEAIKLGNVPKGDVFQTAKLAAIQAVKQTPILLVHAHPIQITDIRFNHRILEEDRKILVTVEVTTWARTGVELEALNGVWGALLTILDLVKFLEKDLHGEYPETFISGICVTKKIKGSEFGENFSG